jgi:hypothetical protein
MRTPHRTSLSSVRLIPAEIETPSFDGDEPDEGTHKLQSPEPPDPPPVEMGCPLVRRVAMALSSFLAAPRFCSSDVCEIVLSDA